MQPQDYKAPFHDWYEKMGVTPASTASHGVEEDISKHLVPSMPRNWRLEGSKLIADTDMGRLVQDIGTGYILTGTDEKGQPLLQKIEL